MKIENELRENRKWREITIEESGLEIEDGDRGKNYPNKAQLLKEGYCPFLNNKNIIGDKLSFEDIDFISKEKDKKLRKGKAYCRDIILTTRGSVGNVALFHEGIKFNFVRINSGMVIIRNNELFDLNFLYQQLKSPYMKSQYKAMATGSAQPQLPIRDIRKLKLLYPPLGEQKAIAHILSTLDEKIEINNKINSNLEEMAQAIFKQWFVDFEFPNEDGEPYKTSGGEMIESELGMIPRGWEVGILSDMGNVIGGATPSKKKEEYFVDKGIPWLTPKDLSNNRNLFISRGALNITEEAYRSTSVNKMPKGTVLFSSRAPIGYIAISKNEITTNQGFKSVVPTKEKGFSSEFIYCWLKENLEFIKNRASGSTFKEISGGEMKKIPALIPTKEILECFRKLQEDTFLQIHMKECETQILMETRDTLLPKLMSGKIRVQSTN